MKNSGTVTTFQLGSEFKKVDDIKTNILSKTATTYARASRKLLKTNKISSDDPRLEMVHSWGNEFGQFVQNISMVDTDDFTVEILVARAIVGTQVQNVWNDSKTDLKQKSKTANYHDYQVIFFKKDKHWYLTIGSNDRSVVEKITTNLIGEKYINSRNIPNLDLFSWLYWKYVNSRKLTSFFNIPSMSAFVGNLGDENDESKITGNSEDLNTMGAMALHIATNEKVKTVKLQLIELDNNGKTIFDMKFKFDNQLTLVLDVPQSFIYNSTLTNTSNPKFNLDNRSKAYIEKIVYTYVNVIPRIIDLYDDDEDAFEAFYGDFRNEMAKKVFDSMIDSGIDSIIFK